ncbi:hypothetical protein QBC46DRAFT_344895 [Diplogelasinospora grovesii]|uniref:Uncharacterized protein n=1 Tax=Diplogelasinospora grovesii TaxID=303347 RepID=A0AAN6N0Z0_9PEZI|nr:hypothetical protein QBC46DRAFT_344895 [Diplogelasinospora grovesii]
MRGRYLDLISGGLLLLLTSADAVVLAAQITPQSRQASEYASSSSTRTRIWSTVESTITYYQFINPRKITLYTTKTVTSLEPYYYPITSFPTTVTEVVISHVTWEGRTTYSNGETSTSVTSFVVTNPETWVVSQPRETDLPAGVGADELPCGDCPSTSSSGTTSTLSSSGSSGSGSVLGSGTETGVGEVQVDVRCEALGLRTGCQGQCASRYGNGENGGGEGGEESLWWCYQMHEREYTNPSLRMGRACWGGNLQFVQLNEPCVQGDRAVACVPCQGVNASWGAVNWSGPE